MAKKLNSVLGIDIGSQQIKIAEIKMQGKEPAVTALGMALTPEGTVDHTGVYDVDQIAAVLKALIHSSGVSVNQAVISIAGQASVLVRTLEVPKMNPAELKDHMQWEITRNIPFAETNIQSDFRAIPEADAAAQNMDVVMALSPQTAIDTLMDIVKKSGKSTAAIDVEPLSIARTLAGAYAMEFRDKTVCVVEIGHKSTSINMYKNGYLLMPRQVPIGGENFTRAIADNLGVSLDEAEHMKKETAHIPDSALAGAGFGDQTQGFQPFNPFEDHTAFNAGLAAVIPDSDPGPGTYGYQAPEEVDPSVAGEAMAPHVEDIHPVSASDPETMRIFNAFAQILDEFLSEVRRSVDYYRSKGGDVDLLVVSGGGAKMKGLCEYLHAALGMPVQIQDPAKGMPINAKRLEPGLLENNRPDFAIAIGNGLHICFE